jgi:protein ImuB
VHQAGAMGKRVADRLACADLRVGVEQNDRLDADAAVVLKRLGVFSPEVEPAGEEGHAFWLNAAGLERLYASPRRWAKAILDSLGEIGLAAAITVGFTRFGTYALARSGQGITVFESPEAERSAVHKVPLARLGLLLSVRSGLAKLGKQTVGDLAGLRASDLLERFGPEAYRLCNLAKGDAWDPLRPFTFEEVLSERLECDQPVANAMELTFLAKRLLGLLVPRVAKKSQALVALEIALALDHKDRIVERIKPAGPTLDEAQLVDLVRLRLESMRLSVGVVEMVLTAFTVPKTTEQLVLFPKRPLRDLEAANRTLARLRAEFGPQAVVWAKTREGHLPEAQFVFEKDKDLAVASANFIVRVQRAARVSVKTDGMSIRKSKADKDLSVASAKAERTLVRRIFTRPIPLQARPVCGPRGCHLLGMGHAPFTRILGPYVVSGGWWVREIYREYHFAETEHGKIVWVYFDKRRRRWFVHGEVS